ncbi:MAG: hypothetical protein WAU45_23850 [Blastocatellia bacterium]
MTLKTRLLKVEKAWYSLEADHYGAHWSELYDQDSAADSLGKEFDKLTDSAEPPYWFWPGKDEDQRKYGWVMSNNEKPIALFDQMLDRLKAFVDGQGARS